EFSDQRPQIHVHNVSALFPIVSIVEISSSLEQSKTESALERGSSLYLARNAMFCFSHSQKHAIGRYADLQAIGLFLADLVMLSGPLIGLSAYYFSPGEI